MLALNLNVEDEFFAFAIFEAINVARKMQNSVFPINLNPQNAENQENEETQKSYLLKMTKMGIKVNKISFLQLGSTFLNNQR